MFVDPAEAIDDIVRRRKKTKRWGMPLGFFGKRSLVLREKSIADFDPVVVRLTTCTRVVAHKADGSRRVVANPVVEHQAHGGRNVGVDAAKLALNTRTVYVEPANKCWAPFKAYGTPACGHIELLVVLTTSGPYVGV